MAASCFRPSKPCRKGASVSHQFQQISELRPSLAKPRSPDCPCNPILTPHKPDGLREGTERCPKETCRSDTRRKRWEAGWAERQRPKEDGLGVTDIWLDQAPFPQQTKERRFPWLLLQVTLHVRCCVGPRMAVGGTVAFQLPCLAGFPVPLLPHPTSLILNCGMFVSASHPEEKTTLKPEHSVVFPGRVESLSISLIYN